MPTLDASQNAFVQAPPGNIRLLAPAGCGKTLCLLHRCLHLQQLQPEHRTRFLIVSFTRAARDELHTRMFDDPTYVTIRGQTEITTLNSWGWRRIQGTATNAHTISSNFDRDRAISNQLQPVWQNYPNLVNAMKGRLRFVPRRLLDAIDTFKSLGFNHILHSEYDSFSRHLESLYANGLELQLHDQLDQLSRFDILPEDLSLDSPLRTDSERGAVFTSFYAFWLGATRLLGDSATFTLEDQKYFAYLDESQKLSDGLLLSGAASYDHILVDEFQDINPLDLSLIGAIAKRNRATLTIVGDDDQAIFEWRGATPEYILAPEKHLGIPFATRTLSVNYRSPRNIVTHSQQLIRHNKRRVEKDISAFGTDDASIEVHSVNGIAGAIDFVEAMIDTVAKAENGLPRIGIVGRKRSQILPYQVSFASKDLPFCAAEDLSIFLSDTFDQIMTVIGIKSRVFSRQRQSEVVRDLLRLCDLVRRRPLSNNDKRFLRSHLQNMNVHTMEQACDQLRQYSGPLKGANKEGRVSQEMAEAISDFLGTDSVSGALLALNRSFDGLQIDFDKAEDDVFYTDPPFGQLAEYARRYAGDFDRFLDDIERAKDRLVYLPPADDGVLDPQLAAIWKQPLHLMTAPRAKGKEFDIVVLLGVNDGTWPHKNSKTDQKLEADRRVFYVAFTRAKRRVVMLVNKQVGPEAAPPSPFIEELELPD